MTARKVVRLADLEASAGEVYLEGVNGAPGREVRVKPIDGRAEQVRQAIADGSGKTGDIWDLARMLLPDATEEEILSLTPTAIGLVTQMACGALEQVLQLAEGSEKMMASIPAAPPSMPAIG